MLCCTVGGLVVEVVSSAQLPTVLSSQILGDNLDAQPVSAI